MEIVFVNTTKELKEKKREYTEKRYECVSCWSGCNCNPESLKNITRDFDRKSGVLASNNKGEKILFVSCKKCAGNNTKEINIQSKLSTVQPSKNKNSMTQQELKQLRKKLPSGAISQIAKDSGINFSMIQRVLSGKGASLDNVPKVLNAVADYLEVLNKAEKEATDRVKAVMS